MKTLPMITDTMFSLRDSNDRNGNWNTPSTEFNLEACGREGQARITATVHGYWSNDTITLYIDREKEWSVQGEQEVRKPVWKCSMSHSSGGRLTKADAVHYPAPLYRAIESDLDAERCFAHALMSVAEMGRWILNNTESLEAFYQEAKAERQQAEILRKAEKAARFEAEEQLGAARAISLLADAQDKATRHEPCTIIVCNRGEESSSNLDVKKGANVTFYHQGRRVSKPDALTLLACSSHRSHIL